MSGQELLYIAYEDEDEHFEHGISYAIYLAKMLSKPLLILLLKGHRPGSRYENALTSIASVSPFPDAHFAAAAALLEKNECLAAPIESRLIEKCNSHGIAATIHAELEATASAVMGFLRKMKVDLVLLSPNVTESRSIQKRLLRRSPHPVVTMARGGAGSTSPAPLPVDEAGV